MRKKKIIPRVFRFYVEGFRQMPKWGRYLWIIILVKAFFMFAILKLFFMPDVLKKEFKSEEERGNYVLEQLAE